MAQVKVEYSENEIRDMYFQIKSNEVLDDVDRKMIDNALEQHPGFYFVEYISFINPYKVTIVLSDKPELSNDEKYMLNSIFRVGMYNQEHRDNLSYVFLTMKIQGCAFKTDISQFMNLGVPMYTTLASILGLNLSEFGELLNTGSIPFNDVKKAITRLTSKGGLYHNSQIS